MHSVCPAAVHVHGVRSRPVKLLFVPAAAKQTANVLKTKTANANANAVKTPQNAHAAVKLAINALAATKPVLAAAKQIADARKTKTANVNAIAAKTAINANAATKMLLYVRSATKIWINVNAAKMLPNKLS